MSAISALWSDEIIWGESFPLIVKFVPMAHPIAPSKVILAEKGDFHPMTGFLYMEFYCGLMAVNAPRHGHNCGRYILLTASYNTCYCNSTMLGETERTHRKEAQEWAGTTPEQKEYRRAYKERTGKISKDEWNAAIAKA